ncbi:hypothetical protein JL720_2582 [Aureococcus anophagefferens]|nr:hypothetical protein JL720_2582 [Aureococcus anophagefferens]
MLVGFGNQPSKLDLKNSSFDVVSQENGIGRGDEPISALVGAGAAGAAGSPLTTYSAVPLWLSSRGSAFLLNDTRARRVDGDATPPPLGGARRRRHPFRPAALAVATPERATWAALQREARAMAGGDARTCPPGRRAGSSRA